MTPSSKREALIGILELLAKINDEPAEKRFGANVAIGLIRAGKIRMAIDSLRQSKNGVLSAMSWEVEAHLGKGL